MTDGIWGKDGFGASRLDGRKFASIEELGESYAIDDDDPGKESSERWRFMGGDRISDEPCAVRLREVEEFDCRVDKVEDSEGEGQGEIDFGWQAARLLSKMGKPQPHL